MSAGQVITGPHFITTHAGALPCAGCNRLLLAATVGGLDRHVDPTPLTDAGELAALLTGRATYDLRGDHLIRRTVHHIRGGTRRLPVVADHTCQPPDPAHVDHTHLQAAVDLVQRLLGAQVLSNGDTNAPPF